MPLDKFYLTHVTDKVKLFSPPAVINTSFMGAKPKPESVTMHDY